MIISRGRRVVLLGRSGPAGGRSPLILAVLLALMVPAHLAGQWFKTSQGVSLWFPGAALGFAILVRYGLRWVPVLLVLRLATVYAFQHPQRPATTVVGVAVVVTSAYALAASMVRLLQVDLSLRRLRDVVLLTGAGILGAGLAAGGGMAVVAARGEMSSGYLAALLDFWVGDAAAITALSPAVLVAVMWMQHERTVRWPRWPQIGETLGQVVAMVAASWWAISRSAAAGEPRRLYPVFLPLGWLAIRRGINGAAVGAALGATAITAFASASHLTTSGVRIVEGFLTAFAVGGVCLGARESERRDAEAALARSEVRVRGVLESASDAFVAIDVSGTITEWNAAATGLFGHAHHEAVGQPLATMIIPERFRAAHEAGLSRFHESGRSDLFGQRLQLSGRHQDGHELPIELVVWGNSTPGEIHAFIHDVSGRLAAEQALRESEERLRLMVENTVDYAMYMLDAGGHVVTWNVGAERLHGYRAHEIINQHFSAFYPADQRGQCADILAQAAEQGRYAGEEWQLRQDASRFWASFTLNGLYDQDGQLRGYGTVTHDLSERKRAEEKLTVLATHDALTGLANRSLLMDRLSQAHARSRRSGAQVAVLFVDLDRFKNVNDGWGHETGDRLLQLVADRIRSVLRPSDTAGRLGGDEFVIICEDLASEYQAEQIADRLEMAIDRPAEIDGIVITISASVGIALAEDGRDPQDSLRNADLAMYSAKRNGRAQHQVYRPTQPTVPMPARSVERLTATN